MKRRDFLRYASCSGVVLGMSALPWHSANAATNRYIINIDARGGWDPTYLFDPKGDSPRADGNGPVNNFPASDIVQHGNISLANHAAVVGAPSGGYDGGMINNFFAKYYQDILVVNGVDHGTNNHGTGPRASSSGTLTQGFPSLAALTARSWQPGMLNPYMTANANYTGTGGITPLLAINDTQRLDDISDRAEGFQSTLGIADRIAQLKNTRLLRQIANEDLPRRKKIMEELYAIRNGDDVLGNVGQYLDTNIDSTSDPSGIKEKMSLICAAFKAGLCVGGSVGVEHTSGLDTHDDHDNMQSTRLGYMFDGIDYLWQRLEALGLADQTTVMVNSDFGRTPYYNSNNGKDHWPIGAYLFMGNGVNGNRVIGATDENYNQRKINSNTFDADDPNGIYLNTAHVITAAEIMLGVDETLRQKFALGEASGYELDLFNAAKQTSNV